MPLTLESPDFDAGSVVPKQYTHDGDDMSPPLRWREAPEGTRSFVLTLDSAADGKIRNHWVIYNIDGSICELPEDVARKDTLPQWTHDGISVRQGRNDFDRVGYTGPLPSSAPPYANTFTLYALDCQLHVPPMCCREDLLAAMQGHILEQAELTAIYTA